MRRLLLLLTLLGCASTAHAQVVSPTLASYTSTDADHAATSAIRVEFFQCTSVVGGAGAGCAVAPFQAGVDVAKAAITTQAPPDAFGNNRRFSLTNAPVGSVLTSLPVGVPFVATVLAVADPTQGGSNSARSAVSPPFYSAVRPLAPVGNVRIQ